VTASSRSVWVGAWPPNGRASPPTPARSGANESDEAPGDRFPFGLEAVLGGVETRLMDRSKGQPNGSSAEGFGLVSVHFAERTAW
jgi:hypothetical protein